ncbi:MAG TPA: TadE/TadG family type IV pilus assembly protein [Stellaceae bacterium]|nr:TadE/TadG family type IV pilus assembly protein [Stellaceae bacterium]
MAADEAIPGNAQALATLSGLGRLLDGVTAIEFALLLPFFVLLLMGIIEFGQALFLQLALQHAVTEAARCASVSSQSGGTPDCSTASNVASFAVTEAYGLSPAASVFSETTPAGFHCVKASYPYSFTLPLGPAFALTLTASSCYPA